MNFLPGTGVSGINPVVLGNRFPFPKLISCSQVAPLKGGQVPLHLLHSDGNESDEMFYLKSRFHSLQLAAQLYGPYYQFLKCRNPTSIRAHKTKVELSEQLISKRIVQADQELKISSAGNRRMSSCGDYLRSSRQRIWMKLLPTTGEAHPGPGSRPQSNRFALALLMQLLDADAILLSGGQCAGGMVFVSIIRLEHGQPAEPGSVQERWGTRDLLGLSIEPTQAVKVCGSGKRWTDEPRNLGLPGYVWTAIGCPDLEVFWTDPYRCFTTRRPGDYPPGSSGRIRAGINVFAADAILLTAIMGFTEADSAQAYQDISTAVDTQL